MHSKLSTWRRLLPALSLPYVLTLSVAGAATGQRPAGNGPFAFHDTDVLGTSLDLQVTALNPADADRVHEAVHREVERLRRILSTYDPASELGRINAGMDPVRVSQELIEVLRLYEQWQTQSRGAFTANLGEAIKLWKQAEKDGRPPEKEALAAAAASIQKPLWRINDAAHSVQRLGEQTINIDSLGKGFVVSQAAIYARAQVPAIRGLLLNIGGDITALGSSSTARFVPWTVAVADPAHPEDNAPPLTKLLVSAVSVATSGNYARGYDIGGKKYSHLIDPHTAAPVDFNASAGPRVVSATAIASDNAAANALAASLCVLPVSEGLTLVRSADAECLLVFSDGTQRRSAGFKRYESAAARPQTDEAAPAGSAAPPVVSSSSATFANGYQVAIDLQLKALKKKAYCAVWVENDKGDYVKTIAIWGNERKYLPTVATWWKWAQKSRDLMAAATRATRAAGKYPLVWDGTDDAGKAVVAGTYKICVETSAEHSGHQSGSTTITCSSQKATATIASTPHFDDVVLTYAPKGS